VKEKGYFSPYTMYDQAIMVLSFSLLQSVHTGPFVYPASHSMDTECSP